MFGTVVPSRARLGRENKECYRQYYCGLCFALEARHGRQARLTLNYDITNEYLLAALAMPQPNEICEGICPYSLRRRHVRCTAQNALSDYFSDLNYLLIYYKLQDNAMDDGSRIAARICAKMEPGLDAVGERLPEERRLLLSYLNELHETERENAFIPLFPAAERFGAMMEFAVTPPGMEGLTLDIFSRINYWLGVWIYTVDALQDCMADHRKKRYNPILAGTGAHPADAVAARREELLEILRACRQNLRDLVLLLNVGERQELLLKLFDLRLPYGARNLLEVKNDAL